MYAFYAVSDKAVDLFFEKGPGSTRRDENCKMTLINADAIVADKAKGGMHRTRPLITCVAIAKQSKNWAIITLTKQYKISVEQTFTSKSRYVIV